jgi:hypothetical protein
MKEYIDVNRYLFVGKRWELEQLIEARRKQRAEVLKP